MTYGVDVDTVDYTTLHQSHEVVLRVELLAARLDALKPPRDSDVAEIGLGSGDTTQLLVERFDKVVCVDLDEQTLRDVEAFIEMKYRAQFVVADALTVTFDRPLDHIFLIGLLEHCPDGEAVLRHLRQYLQPTGRIHILVNNAGSIHRHLGVAIGDIVDVRELSHADMRFGHHRVYTPNSLYAEVSRAGLIVDYVDLHYMKPLPSSMMDELPLQLSRGFVDLGRKFPHLAAYSYVEAVLP